jgi:MFS family permease
VFIFWELRREDPLLDMKVFRDAAFTGSSIVGVIVAASLFGAVFLIPIFMQEIQGDDTLHAGLLLAPQGIGAALAMPISGLLTDRIGARPVVFSGIVVLIAATLLLTGLQPSTPDSAWVVITGLRGVGMGLTMMPNFAAAYVTLAPAAIARATAVANTIQRVSSSFGIALFASILTVRFNAHPFVPPHGPGVTRALVAHLAEQNAARAFDETFWLGVGLAALGLPAAMLLRRPLPAGLAEAKHPPLSAATKAVAGWLLVVAVATLAFAGAKTLSAL